MNLKTGDKVTVFNDEGGEMQATVKDIIMNGNAAVLTPLDTGLQKWFPRGYLLGKAHWDSKVSK